MLGDKYWDGKTLWDKQREVAGPRRVEPAEHGYDPEREKIEEAIDNHEGKWYKVTAGKGTVWTELHYFANREGAEKAIKEQGNVDHPHNQYYLWNGIEEVDSIPDDELEHLRMQLDGNEDLERLIFEPPQQD